MSSYTDVFGNSLQPPVYNSFNSIGTFLVPFTTNVQLLWSTQFQNNPYVVATIMNFYPSMNGLLVILPDATQTSSGAQFYYNNVSGFSFSFHDFAGNLIATIPTGAGSTGILYLTDNTTTGGTWFNIPAGGGSSAVNSIGAVPLGATAIANLIIQSTTTNPITSSGTFEFSFQGDLGSLAGFVNGVGIPVRTGPAAGATPNWVLRALTGVPNQISITNGTGVAGNPLIGLAANIQNVTSLQVGNLLLSGNTIAVQSGSNLILAPEVGGVTETSFPISMLGNGGVSTPIKFYNGGNTHFLSLQGGSLLVDVPLTLPATPPGDGQALVHVSAGQMGWETIAGLPSTSVPNSIPKFLNSGGELEDTAILVTGASNADMTNVNSIVIQNLRLCIEGSTIISTSSNYLGLQPINGITSLIAPVGSASTIQFYNANNVNFTGLSAPAAAAGITFALPPTDAPANSLLMTDGAANLSFTSSSATNANSAGVMKAWVVFNGTTGAITGTSFNVASVTRNSNGNYTVNFTAALSSANYAVTINANQLTATTTGTTIPLSYYDGRTANVINIHLGDTAGAAQDSTDISVTCTVQ